MSVKVGNVVISLTANTSSFQTDMGKASQIALSSSKAIERAFTIMGAAIVAATGTAAGALGELVTHTQETVVQMQRMAQQSGQSMESFSKMAYAAKVAGMPMDQMAGIMVKISKSSFAAASGNKSAAAAYKELGVSVTDANGHFKTSNQLALDIAKSLDKFKDSAAKTGIETIIMGRSGAEAAEFMRVLSNRFEETSATAQKLGIVFGENTAEAARKLHENLTNLEEAGFGLSVKLLNEVSPALDEVTRKILDFVSSSSGSKKVEEFGKDIAKVMHEAADAVGFVADHATTLKHIAEGLIAIRFTAMFAPMVWSAVEAEGTMAKLGIAAFNLSGNLLGIKKASTALDSLAIGAKLSSVSMFGLGNALGTAVASTLKLKDAIIAVDLASWVNPIGMAAGAFLAVAGAMWEVDRAFDSMDKKKKLADSTLSDVGYAYAHSYPGGKSYSDNVDFHKKQRLAEQTLQSVTPKAPGLPEDYSTNSAMSGKLDMKALSTGEKHVDELTKKLRTLHDAAVASQEALAAVGTSPQQKQQAEIDKKVQQFKTEMQNANKTVTPAQLKTATTDIASSVHAEAATKYREALLSLHETMQTTTDEQNAMAAAVGRSTLAMQDATVKAKVNQEMQKIYGVGWRGSGHDTEATQIGNHFREQLNSTNHASNVNTLQSKNAEVQGQQDLNAAILYGKEVIEQAQLAAEQAAIERAHASDTNRDDIEAELAANKELFRAKQDAADLAKAAGMDALLVYEQELASIQKATQAALAHGKAIDYRAVLMANKDAELQFIAAQQKAILATGTAMDGLKVALDQIAHQTESAAQQMRDVLTSVVSSMNDQVAKAMTGQKTNFQGTFRGIGESLAKQSLQKAESTALGAMGFGKKGETSNNPLYVLDVGKNGGSGTASNSLMNAFTDASRGTGSIASYLRRGTSGGSSSALSSAFGSAGKSGLLHSLFGKLNDSNFMGSHFGSLFGAGGSLQGAFADGTDSLIPGMPAIVGEKGPEVFVPPSSGAIVPNSKLKNGLGGGHTFNIDARGSNDPAQTVAIIHRYMEQAAPQIAAHTMHTTQEQARRRP